MRVFLVPWTVWCPNAESWYCQFRDCGIVKIPYTPIISLPQENERVNIGTAFLATQIASVISSVSLYNFNIHISY